MNPPAYGTEFKPVKLEAEEKEAGPLFHCDLYDADIVHKIADEFLLGLASACVDNTTGGLFRTPASVAVGIRREMIEYLVQRSETFVAESIVLDDGAADPSEDPYDIISDFIDDFASSKRNFFSRVSGWLLSEKREDRIDDFAQEMEINGFWLPGRREFVAQTILKNVDFRNAYHCSMSFRSEEDAEEHKTRCGFRTVTCTNEGCNSRFSAAHLEHHDSVCPFKVLECEQNCGESIMRRGMDRHCITVCSMKLVKCTFYAVGCQTSVPQSTVEQHRSDNLELHLLFILQLVHKEASTEDLKGRVEELIKLSSPGKLAAARDARSLTFAIKDLEAKLGPLKFNTTIKSNEEVKNDLTDKKNESSGTCSPTKKVSFEESPTANTESVNSPSKEKETLVESPNNVSVQLESQIPDNKNCVKKSTEEKVAELIEYEHDTSPTKGEDTTDSVAKNENQESTKYKEESKESYN
ncbi:tnf receptor-associated factor family protein ddb_g0290931 [Phtheirospermum japonicum]|uniref:Tnf receptor-associated factor family protein ddb_g0290931 n=1 Tax=Phtheirospermum japonicum TaxID=374723 RepID=A0A830BCR2_9LAMI|nr:tnf receptor-associated factor family protein ddb_g0290931 [Phtheirospermum japonicum]